MVNRGANMCCLIRCVVRKLVCCDTNLRHVVNFIISMGLHLGKFCGRDVGRAGDLINQRVTAGWTTGQEFQWQGMVTVCTE